MSVAIQKIDGVRSVNVTLKRGMAAVQLKPGNLIRLEQVDQAVQNNGFTPKEAKVRVRGQILADEGKLKFKVAGTNDVYDLVAGPQQATLRDVRTRAGKEAVLEGTVPAPNKRKRQKVIQVVSFEAEKGG